MMIIAQGAEAIITKQGNRVTKQRQKKTYRIPALDQQLRKRRTQREARLLIKARRHGIPVPRVIETSTHELVLEFLPGQRVRDALPRQLPVLETLGEEIGIIIAKLHTAGIVHGDLTTSNMILHGHVMLIDFGLALPSTKIEDQANDLFLFLEGIQAAHPDQAENLGAAVLKAYKSKYSNAKGVLKQLAVIRKRRRYG